jgi:hypothetical protein
VSREATPLLVDVTELREMIDGTAISTDCVFADNCIPVPTASPLASYH